MWPGSRPATGWMANCTSMPRFSSSAVSSFDGVLRLRDRHTVARDDDDAARREQQLGHVRGAWSRYLAGRCAPAARRLAGVRAEATEDDVQDRPVHRAAHDMLRIAPLELPTSAPVMIEQVVRQHEAGRRRRPPRVAVEQRHHDRHVAAADGHDQVRAEQQRDAGHGQQRRQPGRAGSRRRRPSDVGAGRSPPAHAQGQHDDVQDVPPGQQQRLAADRAAQLAERDHRAAERHGADQDADEDLAQVCAAVGRPRRRPARGRLAMPDQHRGRADEAVQDRDELGHGRHRDARREDRADHAPTPSAPPRTPRRCPRARRPLAVARREQRDRVIATAKSMPMMPKRFPRRARLLRREAAQAAG